MSIEEYEVRSLSEYLNVITGLKRKHNKLWFRGHASSEYSLIPTVYREPYTWKNERAFYISLKPGRHVS